MVYLPIITAVVSGLLVWVLGRWNVNREEHKQEKKRLNRLLFNMLELKHWVDKEVGAGPFIAKYMEKMVAAIKEMCPEKSEEELTAMTGLIAEGIKRSILKQPQLPRLEQNINEIIRDYSEIDPFFAYDLTGKYLLTENLEIIKEYLAQVVTEDADIPQATAFLNQLFRPGMLADIQRELVEQLPRIAAMIDTHSLKEIKKNHLSPMPQISEAELETYCAEILPRLVASIAALETNQPPENPLSLRDE